MNNFLLILFVIGFLVLFIFFTIYYQLRRLLNKVKASEKTELLLKLKCLDGHIVKSKGELIIDNYLYLRGIQHIYEKTIKINGKSIKPDWFLPKLKLYIEYWGFYGKEYTKRKEEKIKLYHMSKINLISVENHMFSEIYTNLDKMLKKYEVSDKKGTKKYCFNCGIILDDRFR